MRAEEAIRVIPGDTVAGRRLLGRIVIGSLATFVVILGALHWLRPDVNALARVTSEYAVGPYGPLMTASYVILGIALVSLALGLARSLGTPVTRSAGLVLLIAPALAMVVAAAAPIDVGSPRPVTTTGWIHRFAAIVAFTSMALAPLLLTRPFRRDPVWRDLAPLGVLVGVAGMAGFLSIQLFLLERGLAGAAQRVVLGLMITWMVAVALRLGRSAVPVLERVGDGRGSHDVDVAEDR